MRLSHEQYVDVLRAGGERLAELTGRDPLEFAETAWCDERTIDGVLSGPADALTAEGDAAVVALLRERLRAATQ